MAMTATLVKRYKAHQGLVGIFTLAASGSYSSNGDSVDFSPKIGYTNKQPRSVQIQGISGYFYEYNLSTKKVIVRRSAPAGSIAAPIFTGTAATPIFTGTAVVPSFTVKNGSIVTDGGLGLTADAANANLVGGVGITTDRTLTTTSPVGSITPAGSIGAITPTGVVSAPAFTGTAAALAELAATTYPAGVTGDTITAVVLWTI